MDVRASIADPDTSDGLPSRARTRRSLTSLSRSSRSQRRESFTVVGEDWLYGERASCKDPRTAEVVVLPPATIVDSQSVLDALSMSGGAITSARRETAHLCDDHMIRPLRHDAGTIRHQGSIQNYSVCVRAEHPVFSRGRRLAVLPVHMGGETPCAFCSSPSFVSVVAITATFACSSSNPVTGTADAGKDAARRTTMTSGTCRSPRTTPTPDEHDEFRWTADDRR